MYIYTCILIMFSQFMGGLFDMICCGRNLLLSTASMFVVEREIVVEKKVGGYNLLLVKA
jgi:hypothetical protein